MHAGGTSLTSWAKAIRKAVDAAGCDSASLFREAGLDWKSLDDPNARYPLAGTTRLWRLAVAATGDPAFGLNVARQVTPTTFHALGYSLQASPTLADAFERMERYFRIVTDAAGITFSRAGPHCHVLLRPHARGPGPAPEAFDAFAAVLVRMCRGLAGRELSPLRVELCHPAPHDPGIFQRVFRAPIEFDARQCCLTFERAAFEQPLEGANAELARHNDEIVLKYLARFDKGNILARVEAALIEQLPHGEPSAESVAATLHLSARSLQRRLAEENTSYKERLDATRRDLALSYLRDPHYSVSEITYLLGFSDTSSFTRAFRRWTGVPPSKYRAA